MIKKISQLNRIPEEYVVDKDDLQLEGRTLLEVSYANNYPINQSNADEVEYYTSYSTDLSTFGKIIGLEELKETLPIILSGGISVIQGPLSVGQPGNETDDRDLGHKYYPDVEHGQLVSYIPLNLQNNLTAHGETQFHNNVVIKCNDRLSTAVSNGVPVAPVLSVQGVAQFDNVIYGTAYRAQWGDLAELYEADSDYEPGTLVKFGGEKEITVANERANGVVTSKPGIVLNESERNKARKNFLGVALVGRVPIKVRGPVNKFDNIVLSKTEPGIGVVYNYSLPYEIIGKALEANFDPGDKLVMCAVRLNLV